MASHSIKSFTDLLAWQCAYELALDIYKLTKEMPTRHKSGIANQMERAAVSISSNIAEGFGRQSRKDKAHFYQIALGSLFELDSQIRIALGAKIILENNTANTQEKIQQTGRLIRGLVNATPHLK